MSIGPTAARKRTRDLAEFIRIGAPKGTDVLDLASRELAPVLDTEQAVGIRLGVEGGGITLASVRSPFPGACRVERALRSQVESQPRSSATFDPTAPDPAQRNVVLSLEEIQRFSGRTLRDAPAGRLLAQSGFALADVIRSLLCDGPSLLGWFGAFRERAFDARERGLLSRIVRPLRDRLVLQERLAATPWVTAAMRVVLDSTGSAAVVFRRPMRLLYCNGPAKALLASDRAALLSGLREALAGSGSGAWIVHPLVDVEGPDHFIAMRRAPPCDPGPRAAAAATHMGLTPRQTRVLELVARGQSNRAVAASLGCSVGAVEQHVTALLGRFGVESRAELVARFWTDRDPDGCMGIPTGSRCRASWQDSPLGSAPFRGALEGDPDANYDSPAVRRTRRHSKWTHPVGMRRGARRQHRCRRLLGRAGERRRAGLRPAGLLFPPPRRREGPLHRILRERTFTRGDGRGGGRPRDHRDVHPGPATRPIGSSRRTAGTRPNGTSSTRA